MSEPALMPDIESRFYAKLDEIASRSWLDRAAMAVLCTIGAASIIGLATTVISLRVSYAELSGSIDRLADSVKAENRLDESRTLGIVDELRRLERVQEENRSRIRILELAVRGAPVLEALDPEPSRRP